MCRNWLLMVILVGCCLTACRQQQDAHRCIMPDSLQLQTGDVVLRCGAGMLSHAVLLAEGRNGVYSHVGIVADSAGCKMVIHAVPDEPDYEGDPDRVKMEPPEKFFDNTQAVKGEVLRHRDRDVAAQAAEQAMALYKRRTLFDHDYDDSDTTRMYCTELVVFAFSRSHAPLKGISSHRLPLPGVNYECVLPSDILECEDFISIISF